MVRWKISLRRKKVYKREHERGISLRRRERWNFIERARRECLGGGGVEARMMNI